ncbi:MAG TPA: IclR family transcriptional regulator [Bradyrhizobium sp.]|jgi:DNA-binding IclR family transcriptional regulator
MVDRASRWIDELVEGGDPPRGTQSIHRAFLVLRVVSIGKEGGHGLNDIATATGLTRPTVHRVLAALMAEGAVEQRPKTQRYLASKYLNVAALRPAASPLLNAANPFLDEAVEKIGDTVSLTLRSGLETICVARRLGSYPIQILSLGVGVRRPIGISASGIALLSSLSPGGARKILTKNQAHLRANGTNVRESMQSVVRARERGYALRERGLVQGTKAVSIAFSRYRGEALATLTVTAIAHRLPTSRVTTVVEHLRDCAASIENALED